MPKTKEEKAAYDRQRYLNNKEYRKNIRDAWNIENKDKRKKLNREFAKSHPEISRGSAKRKRLKRKQFALELLGNKCKLCNATENLEFDHIKPETKEYNITDILTNTFTVFVDELYKCQLLCKDCHISKTYQSVSKDCQ